VAVETQENGEFSVEENKGNIIRNYSHEEMVY
jgi:hypothetical protein